MILLNLLLIQLIMVFVVDLSGFVTDIETKLAKWLKVKKVTIPKPLSCSLCLTWWSCLLYVIAVGEFNLRYIAYIALLSFLANTSMNILIMVKEILDKIVFKLTPRN